MNNATLEQIIFQASELTALTAESFDIDTVRRVVYQLLKSDKYTDHQIVDIATVIIDATYR
jgi:hypothetical protein